ncbi:MAG TPA: hypothetical protein VGP26_13275 [Actinophytocola sp.]|nr:hypothetical protein [Actinophytocola sp.]
MALAIAAVDFGQGISNAWSSIATFVPKLLAFLVIMFIGWLIAKAIAKAVGKVLARVGFDRVVERGGINRMLSGSPVDASGIIAKLLYYAILLITLQIAFGVWGPNPVSSVLTDIVNWLPKAVVAVVIVVVAGAIARAVRDLLTNALGNLSYGPVVGTIASVFIWGLGLIAALNQIGVATTVTLPVLITVLATIGGIAVVGVGGGLVRPMQARWDRWLNRAESELPQAKAASQAYSRGREDAARMGSAQSNRMPAYPRGGAQSDAQSHPQSHPQGGAADHTRGGMSGHLRSDSPDHPRGGMPDHPRGGPGQPPQGGMPR